MFFQEAGAQQNPIAIFSETPLHVAATLGDADCLQVLLDYGADLSLCKVCNKMFFHLEQNALLLQI
jgi:ankyrin repeat protein